MRYVARDAQGNIIGHFANMQLGFAEEALADDDPQLIAASADKPAKTIEERIAALEAKVILWSGVNS